MLDIRSKQGYVIVVNAFDFEKSLIIKYQFKLKNFSLMGNICEQDSQCTRPELRDKVRMRSFSDAQENLTPKELIQVKKFNISEDYDIQHPSIGKGTFGSVYKAVHKNSGITRAVKRLSKKQKSINCLEEYLILKKLDHPNIIRIFDIYVEKLYIYIVMEYCSGGQLFERIIKKQTLTENEAKHYMKQLLSAISNCHANNIMHRDLKPENIMFQSKSSNDLKIIDFGVGTAYLNREKNHLKVGSIYYMAPEVIKKKYNEKCDVWSLGVILYIMLSGQPPFDGKTDKIIYQKVLKGKVIFPKERWSKISKNALDLISRMLAYAPEERLTAKQALNHRWIKNVEHKDNTNLFVSNELNAIREFCDMNSFQLAIMSYISHNLIQGEVLKSLEKKFKMMDDNGDGRISYKEFRDCYRENMPPTSDQQLKSIFETLDKNNSGFIDYSQFLTSTMNKSIIENENLFEKAFNMIDKDGDGNLSREEMAYAFGGSKEELYNQIIQEFDTNNDGFISKTQFKIAMNTLLSKQQP